MRCSDSSAMRLDLACRLTAALLRAGSVMTNVEKMRLQAALQALSGTHRQIGCRCRACGTDTSPNRALQRKPLARSRACAFFHELIKRPPGVFFLLIHDPGPRRPSP